MGTEHTQGSLTKEAIRLAWKQATGHQSVLWAQQAVEVSF